MQTSESRSFQSRNPLTNEVFFEAPFLTDAELNSKIEKSWAAFQTYKDSDVAARCEKLSKLADLIEADLEKFAKIITQEMGKPIKHAIDEIKECVLDCRFYAKNSEEFIKPDIVPTENMKSLVEYQPIGPLLHIVPFNYPWNLLFKGGIPCLVAGNTILFRPADSTPLCGKAIEELLVQAGFNNGEFQTIYTSQAQTEVLLAHKHVRGVSFTGSTRAGRIIASMAGKYGKKAVMELGGSDPFILLDDADLEKATELAMNSRLGNSGQVCIASKRFIVESAVYEAFKEHLIRKLPSFKIGDPMNPETDMGPMARPDLAANIERQVKEAVDQGAKLIHAGKKPDGAEFEKGSWCFPTVCEVEKDNLLMREETFGPVFALIKVKDEAEAVELANDTEYGLGCVIASENRERAEKVGRKIDTGSVWINRLEDTDNRLPFGGVKGSGFGRTKGKLGVLEFMNIKAVVIN